MSMRVSYSTIVVALISAACSPTVEQGLDDGALVDALRQGGYVIVMRHARSPRERPDAQIAAAGNTDRERQLDEEGQETARSMGAALKALEIPIGDVLSSPTFRALETAQLLDLARAEPVTELGEGGQGMQEDTEGVRSAWLRAKAGERPRDGTNRLMITHFPNLVGAFGDAAADIADGESLIIEPDGGNAVVIGRVRIEQWPELLAAE